MTKPARLQVNLAMLRKDLIRFSFLPSIKNNTLLPFIPKLSKMETALLVLGVSKLGSSIIFILFPGLCPPGRILKPKVLSCGVNWPRIPADVVHGPFPADPDGWSVGAGSGPSGPLLPPGFDPSSGHGGSGLGGGRSLSLVGQISFYVLMHHQGIGLNPEDFFLRFTLETSLPSGLYIAACDIILIILFWF